MNYKVIKDEQTLIKFIDWLPDLQDDECYYFCLFARSKYCKNEDGTNKFPHIKSDKSQLKRFVATNKDYIIRKIKQLEIEVGNYTAKNGFPIPQEALALYVTPNPRGMKKAMFSLMKRLIDIQECRGTGYNIHAESLSAIQKSPSRKVFFDLDIDDWDEGRSINFDTTKINPDCIELLRTRGGFHFLVRLNDVDPKFKKTWYNYMTTEFNVDICGDNMIPVPGCVQGDFVPILKSLQI